MSEEYKYAIPPHGGKLVDRVLRGEEREAALERAKDLPRVYLSAVGISDLELISVGAFSPLTGFLCRADYEGVVENMHLTNGILWPVPITLPVSREKASTLSEEQEVALVEGTNHIMGLMRIQEKYAYDKEREAEMVYRTTEDKHPGVNRLYKQGEVLLGGDVWLLDRPSTVEFPELRHDPAQTRRMFAQRGWRRVVAFQTRNPVHRAHEYIQKTALELCDGLLLHPLVGATKADDIPAEVRIESYRSLLRDYYPPDRVLLGVYPAAMRYAGPREAIFHAIARQNYGCTHFIVGRDHAGVGKYYGTYDAQQIFDDLAYGELAITPLRFEHAFYCTKCKQVVTAKTCPHGKENWVFLSGTQVREKLRKGESLPLEFTRPEVSDILVEGMRQVEERLAAEGKPKVDSRKVMVIGLDCLEPSLVFEQWRDRLRNMSRLMEKGAWGRLESTNPPITVPAWSSMVTSKDPGQLGFYGFRNRADYSYDRMRIANSKAVTEDTVWDIASREGKDVVLVGVPQTYPPKPTNGYVITSFLTPSTKSQYTYPHALKQEIEALVGEFILDVEGFRTDDKDALLGQIYDMTRQRFQVVRYLAKEVPWQFFMFVEMGPDRIHHGMWKYMDPRHPKYQPGSKYENAIRDYYEYLDGEIGTLLELLDDETVVLLVSDHGAQPMMGGICFNEWLIKEGYLVLKEELPKGHLVPIEKLEIDWSKTKAWGSGGYYGRLFLNVEGREPQGIIPRSEYEQVRNELAEKLSAISDPQGNNIGTVALKPEEVYHEVRNIAPDLIVYFGDLAWRSVGSLGHGSIYTSKNDTGPDDANHARQGVFVMYDPKADQSEELSGLHIMDVAPTILSAMGIEVPRDMEGTVVSS